MPTNANSGGRLYWIDLMRPYINDSIPVPNVDEDSWFSDGSPNPELFKCPTLNFNQCTATARSGMGYNNYGLSNSLWTSNRIRLIDIRRPSDILVVIDAMELSPYTGASSIDMGSKIDCRHSGDTANVLYADGHCKTNKSDMFASSSRWSYFYRKYPYMEDWQ